jgi:hypothetical protein
MPKTRMPKSHGPKSRTKRQKSRVRAPRGAAREIPSKDTIIGRQTLIAPDGTRYTILETNQTDPYDPPTSGKRQRKR